MNLDAVLARPFPETVHAYSERDSLLYALAVGLGADPTDERQLPFVYEGKGPAALPTMAAVIGMEPFWLDDPALEIDWPAALHGEESIELYRPFPAHGEVRAQTRITDIVDKGAERGALIALERRLSDIGSGAPLATIRSTLVARGDGGFSETPNGSLPALAAPRISMERKPDAVIDLPTLPQSALLYRLCGDLNPLHADPAIAAAAGFPQPILHGLCTFAVAGHALLRDCCGYDATLVRSIAVRFVAPVYPGETIRTEIWRDDDDVAFRARVVERDMLVLDRGAARLGTTEV